jgi:hypothetical protein
LKQSDDVIEALIKLGGFATFGKLNQTIDFSNWVTKTPEASVRRIVQQSDKFFRIRKGLWGLNEMKNEIADKLKLDDFNENSNSQESINFTHSYYQGLLVEIGNMQGNKTYIPAQDKNKQYLQKKLGEVTQITSIPEFTYNAIVRRAKTVDVIWFGTERNLPKAFFEVEHSTDIKNSLSKFHELQDFRAKMYIVADNYRKKYFDDTVQESLWKDIRGIVKFLPYDYISNLHTRIFELEKLGSTL